VSTNGLAIRWRTFSLWKRNNAPEEYEDACAGDPLTGRFAIADGASEASFAAIWARLLVDGFLADTGFPWRTLDWLRPIRSKWSEKVGSLPLPWYAEEKREQGAFATFLGLAFRPPREGHPAIWRALAVGDCCLFRTRGERVLQSFPMTRSADFGNRPRLLASRGQEPYVLDAEREQARGRWRAGDRFLLMTDALAQWFLLRTEQGGKPLQEIRDLEAESEPEDVFAGWVDERRNHHGLRNDDVTLAVIDVLAEEQSKQQDTTPE
jgi:hypothetical protein